ncbi:type II toxin-antitoxin system RnlB family antitoxin [Cytobacillus kochii]
MKKYGLIQLSGSEYQCMVLATSYEDPLQDIQDIERELKDLDVCGKILFDMLAHIGDNSERFLEANFDGDFLVLDSFRFVTINKNSAYRQNTKEFFSSKSYMLEGTILTTIQKNLISHGISI